MLAVHLAQVRGLLGEDRARQLLQGLDQLPVQIEETLKSNSVIEALADRLCHKRDFLYLGRGINYRLFEDRLHADSAQMTLTYIFRPTESTFPPFFAAALVARLSGEFCIPLTESSSRAQLLFNQAEDELRAARRTDSQQATTRALDGFPLIRARG